MFLTECATLLIDEVDLLDALERAMESAVEAEALVSLLSTEMRPSLSGLREAHEVELAVVGREACGVGKCIILTVDNGL